MKFEVVQCAWFHETLGFGPGSWPSSCASPVVKALTSTFTTDDATLCYCTS